jgi:hypothetical protein
VEHPFVILNIRLLSWNRSLSGSVLHVLICTRLEQGCGLQRNSLHQQHLTNESCKDTSTPPTIDDRDKVQRLDHGHPSSVDFIRIKRSTPPGWGTRSGRCSSHQPRQEQEWLRLAFRGATSDPPRALTEASCATGIVDVEGDGDWSSARGRRRKEKGQGAEEGLTCKK